MKKIYILLFLLMFIGVFYLNTPKDKAQENKAQTKYIDNKEGNKQVFHAKVHEPLETKNFDFEKGNANEQQTNIDSNTTLDGDLAVVLKSSEISDDKLVKMAEDQFKILTPIFDISDNFSISKPHKFKSECNDSYLLIYEIYSEGRQWGIMESVLLDKNSTSIYTNGEYTLSKNDVFFEMSEVQPLDENPEGRKYPITPQQAQDILISENGINANYKSSDLLCFNGDESQLIPSYTFSFGDRIYNVDPLNGGIFEKKKLEIALQSMHVEIEHSPEEVQRMMISTDPNKRIQALPYIKTPNALETFLLDTDPDVVINALWIIQDEFPEHIDLFTPYFSQIRSTFVDDLDLIETLNEIDNI